MSWAVVALLVVLFAALAWSRRHMSDDGYIHLRVVKQLLAGHGPVFNAGERVEASSSPLWVFVLAVADVLLPLSLEWIAVILGVGFSLAAVVLATIGARRLSASRRATQVFIPAGAAVIVALTPFWTYSTSGLEGGLALAWLGLCLVLLAGWARSGRSPPAASAIVVGLGPLIRPDLAVFSALFLLVLLWGSGDGQGGRQGARTIALVVVVPVLYELFRLGYYGSPVPNPAIAKEAGRTFWSHGWAYLRDTVKPYWTWFPLAVLALGAYRVLAQRLVRARQRRALLVTVAFVWGGLLHALYIVGVGGDFMHARLLLPSLFALLAPVAVVPWDRRHLIAGLVIPWAVVAGLFLRSSHDTHHFFFTTKVHPVTLQDFNWGDARVTTWYRGHGVYYGVKRLPARPAPGRDGAVASWGIGISSYALGTDVYVLDLLGLADPFTARLDRHERGFVGHEKPLPTPWIVARLTAPGSRVAEDEVALPTAFGIVDLGDPGRDPFATRVATARAVLRCPDIRDLTRAYTDPLTLGRMIENVVHSLQYWRLRIPPEPADARERFCRA